MKKKSLSLAFGIAAALVAATGVGSASAAIQETRGSDGYTFVRTAPTSSAPLPTTRVAPGVRVTNDGIVDAQMCDGSQVLQSSAADGPGTLGLSFARQVQSQASVSVTAGVSASVTAEVGLSATVQGFGATGKLGTTVGGSLSTTFGYNVLDSTTITSSYTASVPAGETWSVSAYPAFAKYNYSVYANSWKNGTQPIASGQLLSPVGYCYKTSQLKKLTISAGFAAADSATPFAAVRYQPSGANALGGWAYSPDGSIRLSGGDLCMELPGQDFGNAPVNIAKCNNGYNQRWERKGQTLVNMMSGKCLDLPGGIASPGRQLIVFDCNGTGAQNWGF